MIKNAKENAKILIFKHFKSLFIPSTIIMLFNAIAYLFFNVIITHIYWEQFNHMLQIFFLICFIVLEFVCIPLSSVLLFKTIYSLDQINETDTKLSMKQAFSYNILLKSVKVNFIPSLLRIIVYACSTKVFYYNRNYTLAAILTSCIGIYVSYKFFAANYFIALESKNPIRCSFGLIKNAFFEYLLFGFSFIGYIILAAGIGVLLQYLLAGNISINLYIPQLKVFNSFGYGIGFFLTPYIYAAQYYWLRQKDANKRNQRKSN